MGGRKRKRVTLSMVEECAEAVQMAERAGRTRRKLAQQACRAIIWAVAQAAMSHVMFAYGYRWTPRHHLPSVIDATDFESQHLRRPPGQRDFVGVYARLSLIVDEYQFPKPGKEVDVLRSFLEMCDEEIAKATASRSARSTRSRTT